MKSVKIKDMKEKNENLDWGDFSALLSVFLIVFIVIYADGSYDIWDAVLGIMTLVSLWKFRPEIKKKELWINIGLVAFAISVMILLRFFDSVISALRGNDFIISEIKANYENSYPKYEKVLDFDFIVFFPIFLISFLIVKFTKIRKK